MCSFITPNRLVLTSCYLVLFVSCICLFQLFFISFCYRARENILISCINIWRFMEPFLEFRYVLLSFILTSKYNEHWINFIKTFCVIPSWLLPQALMVRIFVNNIFREQEEEIKKNVPDYVITHGILSKPDLEKLLQDTKVCISFLCIWSC